MASGMSLRASASVPAPAVENTPLSPAIGASAEQHAAKVGSSSTISTNGRLADARRDRRRIPARLAVPIGSSRAASRSGAGAAPARQRDGAALQRKYRVKVEPLPGVELDLSSPPSRRVISRLIERPRPVPPYLRLVVPSACWKASKISFCLSSGMPMPVSVTAIGDARSALQRTG